MSVKFFAEVVTSHFCLDGMVVNLRKWLFCCPQHFTLGDHFFITILACLSHNCFDIFVTILLGLNRNCSVAVMRR